MDSYKLVGVMSGEYEGRKWGKLVLLRQIDFKRGCGWIQLDKENKKCTYDLAVEIQKDWNLYENQEVVCSCDLSGRIDHCELAG